MPTDDERIAQLRRDNGDRVAPWAGYGWKVNELLDRVQAAEAEVRRLRAERTAMLDAIEAAEAYVETPPPARTIGQAEDLCGLLDRVRTLIGDDDE